MTPPLHIVLYQPEIPPNTGNIARLCACTGCQLHLVHPLGFRIDDRELKRAGLDYWPHLNIQEHKNWTEFLQVLPNAHMYALSTKAHCSIWNAGFRQGDVLVFGPETRGLPEPILSKLNSLRIPMRPAAEIRSLNLSTACGVTVYEALRQMHWKL